MSALLKDFLVFCRGKVAWVCRRVFVLYIILFCIFLSSVHYNDLASKGRGAAFSRLMPAHEWIFWYFEKDQASALKHFDEFVHYYEQLVEYMPYAADAFGMMGFFYYHLGDKDKALAAYQRAIELNPLYFWSYYNKGLIHFENGEYAQSLELFRSA